MGLHKIDKLTVSPQAICHPESFLGLSVFMLIYLLNTAYLYFCQCWNVAEIYHLMYLQRGAAAAIFYFACRNVGNYLTVLTEC